MKGDEIFPKGFQAATASAAIKKPGRSDMALIYSQVVATAAGTFTKNLVKAACVLLDMERLKKGNAQAILANSGNANACTGQGGLDDAIELSKELSSTLGISEDQVLLASTGVIGQRLPLERMKGAIAHLVKGLSRENLPLVAQAIMTTDTFPKIAYHRGSIKGHDYRIYAVAKGAGMIMPNMATMLCFLLTDLAIGYDQLKGVLLRAVDKTFNKITVDGDTSTNDMVLALANGLAGNPVPGSFELEDFENGVGKVLRELSSMIVRDGEGATKLVMVKVIGARDPQDAELASRTICNSMLVKTAIFGEDPNWGRIMAALGRSGCMFEPGKVDIFIGGIKVVENGLGLGYKAEESAKERMRAKEFEVLVDLKMGKGECEIITCDLSFDYVKINAEYRT